MRLLSAPAIQMQVRRVRQELAQPPNIVSAVRRILEVSDDKLDYAKAKVALDALIDPDIDEVATFAEIDSLATKALQLAGPPATSWAKLQALRKLIYVSGPWNGWRPFAYDHGNVRGKNVRLKLISNYLATRLGDCVSMPVLFLILADKLGLDMALSLAPNHFFLKHRLDDGRVINLEPTSGANYARDEWLRHVRPMSDRSVESGMHLRALSKREGIASMAASVVQFLRDKGRLEETAELCELILAHNPRDGLVLVNLAGVCGRIFEQLRRQYPNDYAIPAELRATCWKWLLRNRSAGARARALGWEDVELQRESLKEKAAW